MSKYVTGLMTKCHLFVKHWNLRDIHGYPGHPIDASRRPCLIISWAFFRHCENFENLRWQLYASRGGILTHTHFPSLNSVHFCPLWTPVRLGGRGNAMRCALGLNFSPNFKVSHWNFIILSEFWIFLYFTTIFLNKYNDFHYNSLLLYSRFTSG